MTPLGGATVMLHVSRLFQAGSSNYRPEVPTIRVKPALLLFDSELQFCLALVGAAGMIVLSSRRSAAAND